MSIDVLQDKIRSMKNPTVLGLSPTPELIPPAVLEAAENLPQAYQTFCCNVMEAVAPIVPAVQVQFSCFAVLGAAGMTVLDTVLHRAKELGFYIILDADLSAPGQVASAVAQSIFGEETIFCDALTLNGYLGTDSVKPFLPYCKEKGKSLFVTVKSPNRSGSEIQDLLSGGRLVHTAMADLVNRWGQDLYGKYGYSQVGAIVGAPHAGAVATLRAKYDRVFFLVTGYDSQSGNAKTASAAFDRLGRGAAVCAARYILGAWQAEGADASEYASLALAAAERMKKNLGKYILTM